MITLSGAFAVIAQHVAANSAAHHAIGHSVKHVIHGTTQVVLGHASAASAGSMMTSSLSVMAKTTFSVATSPTCLAIAAIKILADNTKG